MQTLEPKRGRRRRFRRAVLTAGGLFLTTIIALWLTFQHKPRWYRPVILDAASVQHARRTATAAADDFGTRLVQREPFELRLRQEEVTEWLAGLGHIWPEGADEWPEEFRDPVVHFDNDAAIIGALMEWHGWRVVLSVELEVDVCSSEDELLIRVVQVRGGSLPIPLGVAVRLAQPEFSDARRQRRASTIEGSGDWAARGGAEQLLEGIRVRNRFVWPNGRRPFRITSLQFESGAALAEIEPISHRR